MVKPYGSCSCSCVGPDGPQTVISVSDSHTHEQIYSSTINTTWNAPWHTTSSTRYRHPDGWTTTESQATAEARASALRLSPVYEDLIPDRQPPHRPIARPSARARSAEGDGPSSCWQRRWGSRRCSLLSCSRCGRHRSGQAAERQGAVPGRCRSQSPHQARCWAERRASCTAGARRRWQ